MKKILFSILLVIFFIQVQAQNVTITPNGITPAQSLAYPRITYDAILALPTPQAGDLAYDITFDCLRVFSGGKWVCSYQNPRKDIPNMSAIVSAGGTSNDIGQSIAVDSIGNVYITGYYTGTATFGTTILIAKGGLDIFVAKYSKSGAFEWVQSAGGTGNDLGYGIAVDSIGNVFITGYYSGTSTFATTNITSQGSTDIFIANYNSSGSLQWVQSAGGTGGDAARSISLDKLGNVLITGYYSSNATFSSTSITSQGSNDIFIAKYSINGTFQWVQSAGGTNNDYAIGIVTDVSGNVYVTGDFTDIANFSGTSKTSLGSYDIFVAKYNITGVLQWVQTYGDLEFDLVKAIAIDKNSNIYLVGDFYRFTRVGTSANSLGSNDAFVAKLDNLGSPVWLQTIGGKETDYGESVAVDNDGNVYVTGMYSANARFSFIDSFGDYFNSKGGSDIFIAKYNIDGFKLWVHSAGGKANDYGSDVVLDKFGNLYATGYYSGTAIFDATTKTSKGGFDIFIVRLDN